MVTYFKHKEINTNIYYGLIYEKTMQIQIYLIISYISLCVDKMLCN